MKLLCSLVLNFLFAVSVLISGVAKSSATTSQCSSLFSSSHRSSQEFPIQWMERFPLRKTSVLSDNQLLEIFKDVPMFSRDFGRRALQYMKTLPRHLDSETRAQIWMEMAIFIVSFHRTPFISDLYLLPEKRFLFRGGVGETLFIDRDGTMYRLKTKNLYDERTWVADYSEMTPL